MRTALVVGTERSGSTWLANILDAHPEVELWMEPFAAAARLFPGLPEREVPVGADASELARELRGRLAALSAHKHPLLYRRGRPTWLRSVDTQIASATRRAAAALGLSTPLWVRRYELLSLNAAALPARRLPTKHARATLRVLKELRLNFKLGLVAAALPDARVVAILRGPIAQVASIERLLDRGRLGELRERLPRILSVISSHPRFARYAPLAAHADAAADRASALALWWLVSNQTLLEDLRASGLVHAVVRHEELCAAPEPAVAALLRFCTLPPDPGVTRFVHWSSSADGATGSPVDTQRRSAVHAQRALEQAPPELRHRVETTLARARELGVLDPELADLAGSTATAARAAAAAGAVR
jgi:hypothetical protein